MNNVTKREKMDMMRMKDIVVQLADVIYLLCGAKKNDISTIMEQFTTITSEEREFLNIRYPDETKEQTKKPRVSH